MSWIPGHHTPLSLHKQCHLLKEFQISIRLTNLIFRCGLANITVIKSSILFAECNSVRAAKNSLIVLPTYLQTGTVGHWKYDSMSHNMLKIDCYSYNPTLHRKSVPVSNFNGRILQGNKKSEFRFRIRELLPDILHGEDGSACCFSHAVSCETRIRAWQETCDEDMRRSRQMQDFLPRDLLPLSWYTSPGFNSDPSLNHLIKICHLRKGKCVNVYLSKGVG